jgi:hypothetical protein
VGLQLKGQGPRDGEGRSASVIGRIKEWGWDLTTLTKRPDDYQEEVARSRSLCTEAFCCGFAG